MTKDQQLMCARLLAAAELWEAGVALTTARLRREHPELDEAGILALVQAWLQERPGAEFGDAVGRGRRGCPWDPPTP